ncbi:MAG: VOC family virulence protein [Deltaproteobacteria bacterium HGW-Deltaproteobacteria-24]|jgi:catechol 2,3-dioxygenase-like lactoylglutathione lyase family enzyme|nr:MAG: VOC family virulence protein [Deltaproteobacteria bacterium HGW-Deltaproteobacteria-24]
MKYQIKSLDHLVLTVKDIAKTVEFYTTVLGMKKEIFKQNRVALKFGSQKINLHQLGAEFEPKAYNVKEGSADLCFITQTSVTDFKSHIENLGVKVIEGPVKRTGAMGEINSIYVRDPDGNLIEIANYV